MVYFWEYLPHLAQMAQDFSCIDFQAVKKNVSSTLIVMKGFYCDSASPSVV
jgi:hypothetical protein